MHYELMPFIVDFVAKQAKESEKTLSKTELAEKYDIDKRDVGKLNRFDRSAHLLMAYNVQSYIHRWQNWKAKPFLKKLLGPKPPLPPRTPEALADALVNDDTILDANDPYDVGTLAVIFERIWWAQGAHIYYPVRGLLPMLEKASMDVDETSFELPRRSMVVAVPQEDGTMRSMMILKSDRETMRRSKKLGAPVPALSEDLIGESSGPTMFDDLYCLSWNRKENRHGKQVMLTTQIWLDPQDLFELATGQANLPESVLTEIELPASVDQDIDLINRPINSYAGKADREAIMHDLKMLFRLCVYMQACPEAVIDEPPNGNPGWLKVPKRPENSPRGTIVGGPDGEVELESDGLKTHWRTWHFRRYPLRADGTRKPGAVFVRGCVVGLQTPHTVLAGKAMAAAH